jgi:thiamine phosphate synthase YjbQ (UPF0047 family)
MRHSPAHVTLELKPRARYDLIDVTKHIAKNFGDILNQYRKAFYCSFHTTAGYLEQSVCEELRHRQEYVSPFIGAFHKLFPPGADYGHDRLQLRTELSEEQRLVEPKNADSHLIFISSGMENCVSYENKPGLPVYFIELDGVIGDGCRSRQTSVLAYNSENRVHSFKMEVPVSKHPIDSVKLNDSQNGLVERLHELIGHFEVRNGKISIELCSEEQDAGLTVNEYETLLMQHDLVEILKNPIKFMALKGRHALAAPQLIPGKAIDYAKYDLVRVFNELIDVMGVSETAIEKILSIFIRLPASHFLSMKRHISLFVSEDQETDQGKIVLGRYQSPILVQWKPARGETRYVNITLSKFE